ncbi:MFS transporter [Massilia sp. BJB1822]|uniref:MFS transporter n=1 Tax=Massilia sp. BJB1822 TaxID=2744470 RepID=UPI0015945D8A|nr:MFS transporter [Massilia sp. BJB1822]NVD98158.1 MFS transporter [Massilia sp. BJB1822]
MSTNLHLTPARERAILWLLAFIQFTVIMDFMVMMPLAPQLMQAFSISASKVSSAVSVYAWCAGLSGILAATYIDRFDRKRLLLTVFLLFNVSNLACALAPNFHVLVLSRAMAGLTGGVMGAMGMAIIGDIIPPNRRGYATGIMMTSFSIAAIAGVPTGVMLSAHYGWASTFYLLVLLSMVVWLAGVSLLPSLRGHLGKPVPLAAILPNLLALFTVGAHLRAFLLSGLNAMAGMMVIPFISPVLVSNLGIKPAEITWIYLAGGIATLFSARRLGNWSDSAGKHKIYRIVALASMIPMLTITHMPQMSLTVIICLFPIFMVLLSGRNIPLQALMTTVPDPAQRGAFLSANMAVVQMGTGIGALVGGICLVNGDDGHIYGYGTAGWIAVGLTLFTSWWVSNVRSAPSQEVIRSPA